MSEDRISKALDKLLLEEGMKTANMISKPAGNAKQRLLETLKAMGDIIVDADTGDSLLAPYCAMFRDSPDRSPSSLSLHRLIKDAAKELEPDRRWRIVLYRWLGKEYSEGADMRART